ncbi:MAG: hypothetical protein HUK20_12605 [Fibrobacter sp.]|nr:hypothetical protein [Fibrobacter sp.]
MSTPQKIRSLATKPISLALGLNLLFLALCLFFGELHYGVLDDYGMAAILSGAHGTGYNVHTYFVNVLYGYMLLPLYHLFPKISWYYVGEMTQVFCCFTLIAYILIQKTARTWGVLLSSILIAFFCGDFYLQVQFTQCAALLTATGMMGFIWGITERKNFVTALGCILVLGGSIMRWDAFFMGLPFLGVTALVQYRDCVKNYKRILIYAGICALAIYGAKAIDQQHYTSPEYKLYKDFQGPRSAIGDGSDYDRQAVEADILADGKSVEDFDMLRQWKFYDTEVFAVDSIKAYVNYTYKHKKKFPLQEIPSKLLSLLYDSARHYLCWIFFIFGIIILATNPRRGTFPWAILAVSLAMLGYLLSINRVVLRVENGLWIYAALLSIPQFEQIKIPVQNRIAFFQSHRNRKILAASAITLIAIVTSYNITKMPSFQKKQDVYDKVFEYIESRPNTMFLLSMPQYSMFAAHKKPAYLAEPIGEFRRTVCTGFWTPYLPDITQALKDFGITNPIKEVVNDNVLVVGDKGLDAFLQRHYYDSISVRLETSFDNVYIYKYSIYNPEETK